MANSRKLPSDPDDKLIQSVCDQLAALPSTRITVAYSGGLDSTVLLDLLRRCQSIRPFSLSAFHFHHGISPNASNWLAHCQAQCEHWAIPLSFEFGAIQPQAGLSLEAIARDARRDAYARLAADVIAVAHHRDDQVETLLYRLVRGTGVQGAAAMAAQSPLNARQTLWRPLLDVPRHALHAYAQRHALSWIEDESNASTAYDRNFLRHRVVPTLEKRFPSASAAIARAARHFAEASDLLDELAEQDIGAHGQTLKLTAVATLSPARQRNVLRWFLAKHQLHLSEAQLALLQQQMLLANDDALPCLRLGEQEIRRYRSELFVLTRRPSPQAQALTPDGALADWHGRLTWQVASMGLDASLLAQLEARPRQGGERIRLHPSGPHRPVKLLFQEANIAPWLRQQWPLLWLGEQLVAIPCIGVDAGYQVAEGLIPSWEPL